jgi:glycosyltransferase involved in cell wall biosynthesis
MSNLSRTASEWGVNDNRSDARHTAPSPATESARCVVWIASDPSGWEAAATGLAAMAGGASNLIIAACTDEAHAAWPASIRARSLAELLEAVDDGVAKWIVVAGEPCLVPVDLLGQLLARTDDRYATTSFLCNAAGSLSFPFAGTQVPWILGGRSAEKTTELLRRLDPGARLAPVPVAAGPIVAFSTSVTRLLPKGWDNGSESWAESVCAFSLSAQERGLMNVLDSAVFVHRPGDIRPLDVMSDDALARLRRRFHWLDSSIEMAQTDPGSPLRLEHGLAKVKVNGLSILLDGSCLGPNEMGTQVGLIAICHGLAARSDVAKVAVTIAGSLPRYARSLAEDEKVAFVPVLSNGEPETREHFDVMFRPFQPDVGYNPALFRRVADRVVASILDLIAYQNGSYFPTSDSWSSYRCAISDSLRALDGVTTISADVASMIEFERLPIGQSRVFAVAYGTEHLGSNPPVKMPEAFDVDPGAAFLLCLGTNYGHKNRDLAILATQELRRRGHDLRLALVGAAVPHGSTRLYEARSSVGADESVILNLGDVSSSERNWLLTHAQAVVYPTSAEGFGLVPYEAAWLGTPCAFVPFGPLGEISGEVDVTVSRWSPVAFADTIEKLRDPQVAARQIDQLKQSAGRYSWAATCASLVSTFRQVVAMPPVS